MTSLNLISRDLKDKLNKNIILNQEIKSNNKKVVLNQENSFSLKEYDRLKEELISCVNLLNPKILKSYGFVYQLPEENSKINYFEERKIEETVKEKF
jgi:hypothetical protein